MRTALLMLWSVLRNGLAIYGWALAAYASAVVFHAVTGASGIWVLAPAAVLATFGSLRWIWQGAGVRRPWLLLFTLCAAAALVLTSAHAYSRGLALAGRNSSPGLLAPVPAGRDPRTLTALPRGWVLRSFAGLLMPPALLVAAAGTAARQARGLPLATGAVQAPTAPGEFVVDTFELLAWLIATPAAFLAGANLGDNAQGAAQSVGLLITVIALPLGAYGFLRVLWAGVPTRSVRTFAGKAGLIVLLATVGALTLRAATPALDSLFAAAGVAILAVWLVATLVMAAWRYRSPWLRRARAM